MGLLVRIACGGSQKGEAPEAASKRTRPLGREEWYQLQDQS